jgi:exosome complex RNA-binding protein Csl4
MDLKTEIREYFYTIHGSHIETDIANIIAIAEKHIALQLQQTGVITSVCDNCEDITSLSLGMTCPKCNRPFRDIKQTEL